MTPETNPKAPGEREPTGETIQPPASRPSAPPSSPPEGAEAAGDAGDPLRAELDGLKAERDKLKEQLLRTAADFDNFRKRSKRDLDDSRSRGRDDLVRELLPVFDNLERAVASATPTSDPKSVVDGIRMVLKLFEDTSERMGLSRVKSVGERFDPAQHEAIQQLETNEQPPGTIVREIVAGYRFGERLVRPAMVVVARKPPDPPPPAPADAGEPTPDADAPGKNGAPVE